MLKVSFSFPTITFWLLFGNHVIVGVFLCSSTVRWLLFWFEAIKMNLNWTENFPQLDYALKGKHSGLNWPQYRYLWLFTSCDWDLTLTQACFKGQMPLHWGLCCGKHCIRHVLQLHFYQINQKMKQKHQAGGKCKERDLSSSLSLSETER